MPVGRFTLAPNAGFRFASVGWHGWVGYHRGSRQLGDIRDL
jgi:hypothetical protein